MNEKTLVILAAGMGSRFGGMKQIEPVGPNGEIIIDYSLYSAIKYGFKKIIFVIKEENLAIFKKLMADKLPADIEVCYAFQKLDDVPFKVPEGRVKPWGTAHAIYAARDFITGNFGVISSDDFYGDDAFKQLSDAVLDDAITIIGYPVGATLSENGSVKRGVVIHEENKVSGVIESSCTQAGDEVLCEPLDKTKEPFKVRLDNPVSMLMNSLPKRSIAAIDEVLKSMANTEVDRDYEVLLTDIIDAELHANGQVFVKPTPANWMGMTYREDCENVKNFILSEIEKGVYPYNLWNK